MTLRDEHHATRERSRDEQCLRSVRKRKKGRTLGAVDVIDREGYAELECQGGIDVLDSAGVAALEELLDEEVTALVANATLAKPVSRRAPSWEEPRDGRVGRPARADSRAPAPCHGARDSTAVAKRCMAIAPSMMLRRVLYGISCRNYAAAAEAIPGAIGLSGSTVSRAFIQASATKLRELQERDLSGEDVVALVLDGRSPRRRWSSRWASR